MRIAVFSICEPAAVEPSPVALVSQNSHSLFHHSAGSDTSDDEAAELGLNSQKSINTRAHLAKAFKANGRELSVDS